MAVNCPAEHVSPPLVPASGAAKMIVVAVLPLTVQSALIAPFVFAEAWKELQFGLPGPDPPSFG